MSPTDEELMAAYQKGSYAAFEQLYSRHSGRVYGFLVGQLKDKAMADDVFQGTFLKLHRTRQRYDAKYDFVPWLFTICRGVMVDALRKKARLRENPDQDALDAAAGLAIVGADAHFVPDGLDRLTAEQRQALALRYQDDLSFGDIALRLGTSSANVRQLVSRAVRKLRLLK